MKKWLFNPFTYIAGTKALIMGIAGMLVTAIVGYYSKTHFDGAIDIHAAAVRAPLSCHLIEQAIDWGLLVVVFYLSGLFLSRSSVRFIDVAGTTAMARVPLLLAAIAGFGVHAPASTNLQDILNSITPMMIVFGIISIALAIWMIALLYNAYTISTNVKGSKAVVSFIAGLLIAEIATHLLLHSIC